MRRSVVYFIRPVGQEGPIKIGCSMMPASRLASMSVWSPLPLEVVASIPGDQKLERRFHTAFKDDWSHGEWFHASERLTSAIQRIQTGDHSTDWLPEKAQRIGRNGPDYTPGLRLRMSLSARMRRPFRGYYRPERLMEMVREAEFAPPERQAEIVRVIEAAMKNPAAHAKPIELPWAAAHRARFQPAKDHTPSKRAA